MARHQHFQPIRTEAELDLIITDRLERLRAEYADIDDLRAELDRLNSPEEQQRLREEREQAVAAARAEGIAEARTELAPRTIEGIAIALATMRGFQAPEMTVRLVDLPADLMSEGGDVDQARIAQLLDDLAGRAPWALKAGRR